MSDLYARRVMIAAPRSGSGKTTITCALLEVLKSRGLSPVSFKCGPDYIDPLFHRKVLGIDSRNLDMFFAGEDGVKSLMAGCKDRYTVIEGVMGLYDGMKASDIHGSCYEIAAVTNTPIILVIDASGVGRTVISLIKGILADDTHHLIRGLILNKISESFYYDLRPELEKALTELKEDVKLLGFFPRNAGVGIESRHLGLRLPGEIDDIKRRISTAASVLERSADITDILSIMNGAGELKYKTSENDMLSGGSSNLTLAVAYDEAFCFYYKDNLELFEKLGVRTVFFSPLRDACLPGSTDGILLGGGYPENYLPELSHNKTMLSSIKCALDKGIPSLAECGGFMYLHQTIIGMDGKSYEMAGVCDGVCSYSGHLVRFGYLEIQAANDAPAADELSVSLVGMKGHEFHYYDSTRSGEAVVAGKPYKDGKWNCMVVKNNGVWGFPHFYYSSRPEFIRCFVSKMSKMRDQRR